MKLFLKFLKTLGMAILFYPVFLILAFFDSNGNISTWFCLEILIIDVVVGMLLFLFIDFELVKRIKNRKQK